MEHSTSARDERAPGRLPLAPAMTTLPTTEVAKIACVSLRLRPVPRETVEQEQRLNQGEDAVKGERAIVAIEGGREEPKAR